MKIIFDMDGTIADLYAVEGWCEKLNGGIDVSPYVVAKPMVNMSRLARALHKAQAMGHTIEIVSWLCRSGSEEYNANVMVAKIEWLNTHIPSVQFDNIYLVPYGTDKSSFADAESILFDDNKKVRKNFIGVAYEPKDIFDILKEVCR